MHRTLFRASVVRELEETLFTVQRLVVKPDIDARARHLRHCRETHRRSVFPLVPAETSKLHRAPVLRIRSLQQNALRADT